jgi:hypothetical protein
MLANLWWKTLYLYIIYEKLELYPIAFFMPYSNSISKRLSQNQASLPTILSNV